MRINKDSLQARVKNLANKKKVPSNTILQDYSKPLNLSANRIKS